jgi:hypothetical protein
MPEAMSAGTGMRGMRQTRGEVGPAHGADRIRDAGTYGGYSVGPVAKMGTVPEDLPSGLVCATPATSSPRRSPSATFVAELGSPLPHQQCDSPLICTECGGSGDLDYLLLCNSLRSTATGIARPHQCLCAMHSYCMRPPPANPDCARWTCVHCEEVERIENADWLEPQSASFEAEAPDWYASPGAVRRSEEAYDLLTGLGCFAVI